jgi:hypothetical protein
MPPAALCIAPDATVTEIAVPAEYTAQRQVLRGLVGGTVDAAVFHRRACVHVHGEGAILGAPLNVAAWALASGWREAEISYGLHGIAVVTDPDGADGASQALGTDLAAQVKAACAAVHDVLVERQTRPPAGEQAVWAEVLAAAHYHLTTAH